MRGIGRGIGGGHGGCAAQRRGEGMRAMIQDVCLGTQGAAESSVKNHGIVCALWERRRLCKHVYSKAEVFICPAGKIKTRD